MKDIGCTFQTRDGRRIVLGLDAKGTCAGPTTPEEEPAMPTPFKRGMQIAAEVMLRTALRKKFGTPARLAAELGLDEKTINEIQSSTESEMPLPHRRPGDTSPIRSLRAKDQSENVIDYLAEILGQLDEDQQAELSERLAGDRGGRSSLMRRSAADNPPDFPGRPGGRELEAIDRWRRPGEDRRHAADRRRFAHDEMNDRYKDGQADFERRFPGARHITIMG